MSPIQLDASTAEKLVRANSVIDVCDPEGRIIGSFCPRINPKDWIIEGPELTDEELLRRVQSNERRYTTAEVLRHLESL